MLSPPTQNNLMRRLGHRSLGKRFADSCGRAIFISVAALMIAILTLPFGAHAQNKSQPDKKTQSDPPAIELAPIVDTFTPTITDHDLDWGIERAWESRPYRVAVWLCLDGSPALNALASQMADEVSRRSELIDPSSWDLHVAPAPPQWRQRFLDAIERPNELTGFETLPMLKGFDKLMVVCLTSHRGSVLVRVREFDMQTQQWGPLVKEETGQKQRLGALITHAITVAFMPLGRIDRVIEQEDGTDDVYIQARAVDTCHRTRRNADLEWEVVEIKDSPAYVRDDDRFLPVIRRTDRYGNLVRLDPIEFTFLTIKKNDGSQVVCNIQSAMRAPLAGRRSKRAQKLALVIRPPQQSTTLVIQSRGKPHLPVEGLELWARQPGWSKEVPSVLLGKTDWRGMIEIPPDDSGLRLLYVKRGARALKKLPIIPGFRKKLVTTVPNSETSLYAEGVLQGLQKEILNLVIQRQIFERDIEKSLKSKQLDRAKELFARYKKLETPREIKTRLADELVRMQVLTRDKRELQYISERFESLRKLLSSGIADSKEVELQSEIQKQSGL